MRRPVKNRNKPGKDYKYGSELVAQFTNYLMLNGKKTVAEKIVDDAFAIIKEKTKEEPLTIFATAIDNLSPQMEVRSRRVGGANYQVPVEVRPERRRALAFRWILEITRKRKGKGMAPQLASEIMAAAEKEGDAIKKKETMHAMAEANKAFAHFAFARKKKKKLV